MPGDERVAVVPGDERVSRLASMLSFSLKKMKYSRDLNSELVRY